MDDTQHSIGKILKGPFERDAIHVAVYPATAAIELNAGEHVGVTKDGQASSKMDVKIGIVDPFIKDFSVRKGEQFFVFLYPNTIHELKHSWKHIAFDSDAMEVREAEKWLLNFIDGWNYDKAYYTDVELLNKAVKCYIQDEPIAFEGAYRNEGDGIDDNEELKKKFFECMELFTGKKASEKQKEQWFGCCC